MATETVINRPAPFVEDIGKKLSEQALGLQNVPVVTTGICAWAVICVARSVPNLSTNGAGNVLVSCIALILHPLIFLLFETCYVRLLILEILLILNPRLRCFSSCYT